MLAAIAAGAVLMNNAQDFPKHVATTPAHRLDQQWWKDRHAQKLKVTEAGGFDVAFIGDSITHSWESGGKAVWADNFADLKSANFGYSGDRTEHVLWRLENGELIPAQPKLCVIMIGTNNIGHGSSNPAQTADGVRAIVHKLRAEIDGVKILLLGIFPRSLNAADKARKDVAAATAGYADLGDLEGVRFKDIGKHFLRPSGTIRLTMMPDKLHLTPGGYKVWAKAIHRDLVEMLESD